MTNQYQIPPPLANFSFPPSNRDRSQFNFMDSFATTWVTPEFSKEPCFLSLYYWKSSTPKWTSKFNHSTQLNGTEIVPLKMIDSDGLGQLNLNYVDPVGGRKKITGAIFSINHDPTQPKAITWNQNALSSSTTSPSGSSTPTLLASTPATLSTFTISVPPAENTVALPPIVTVTASADKGASSSHGARVTSIVLGTVLGFVFAAALVMFWILRRRRRRTSEQAVRLPSATPLPVYTTTSELQEKDAGGALSELRAGDGRCELDAGNR